MSDRIEKKRPTTEINEVYAKLDKRNIWHEIEHEIKERSQT